MESPADVNMRETAKLIRMQENPNPIVLVFIVLMIIVIVYFVVGMLFTINLSGSWVGQNNVTHLIWHDLVLNTVIVDGSSIGVVRGDLIYVRNNHKLTRGVIIGQREIRWLSGDKWSREIK